MATLEQANNWPEADKANAYVLPIWTSLDSKDAPKIVSAPRIPTEFEGRLIEDLTREEQRAFETVYKVLKRNAKEGN
jgi:hypothetical protein